MYLSGLGFRIWGLGFRVWDFGFRSLGFRSLGFRVWEFRSLGFRGCLGFRQNISGLGWEVEKDHALRVSE